VADPRFFNRQGPFTLGQIATICGGSLAEGTNPEVMIDDVGALAEAEPGAISFFLNPKKYADALVGTRASAVIVNADHAGKVPDGKAVILSDNPHKAYALTAQAFYPRAVAEPGISPHAVIHETASLGEGLTIAPGVVIEAGAEIGDGSVLGANMVVGQNVKIGRECWFGPQVSLSHCLIGDRVVIHTGARIGQDGFGFAIDLAGHVSLPQLGRVILQDGVNVGANSCIDRGAGEDTVIGEGSYIDNLVQIGHNCTIGRHCAISGHVGLSGSVVLGDYVAIGGGAGLADHVTIGTGAQVGARAGVMRDVEPGVQVLGIPAMPVRQFFRQVAALNKLAGVKGR